MTPPYFRSLKFFSNAQTNSQNPLAMFRSLDCSLSAYFPAEAQYFPKRFRPPYENLPGELLDPKKGLAEAHSPDRAIASQFVGHIQQGVSMFHAAIQLKIPLGFLAMPYPLFAACHVAVIMILM